MFETNNESNYNVIVFFGVDDASLHWSTTNKFNDVALAFIPYYVVRSISKSNVCRRSRLYKMVSIIVKTFH